jgi:hypothetical protein
MFSPAAAGRRGRVRLREYVSGAQVGDPCPTFLKRGICVTKWPFYMQGKRCRARFQALLVTALQKDLAI